MSEIITDFIPKGSRVKVGSFYYKVVHNAPRNSNDVTILDHGFTEKVARRKIKKFIPLQDEL